MEVEFENGDKAASANNTMSHVFLSEQQHADSSKIINHYFRSSSNSVLTRLLIEIDSQAFSIDEPVHGSIQIRRWTSTLFLGRLQTASPSPSISLLSRFDQKAALLLRFLSLSG
ncbi:hypothetical protein EZV62_017157 [Acer yangbiense]|uniref:Uncharacterized protein n=1 Tax=Acer yangbiense TaxID=1000413 RepID=A0A5C7HFR0_9ROSI|nr:hypothetical protein EZV62_017157 [Acer yangbiense]